ncbi:class I SAM-dependent methyltransferase [Lyngbya sp. PCC 8106]|uniref:class I SAM-dependent methyltransferase n=1 Tax=Lyngbya sp. (strain PCC 8106) TaxID=313612 RepID=UPI0000EA8C9F|nr:class I SAM-dependent methyltransferase [Lyngbya sp. PCC 8106]EAW36271.1 hypothetical protein L8106_23116 [Lyngbya sp. PCC 8106]
MTNTNGDRKWLIPSTHPLTAESPDLEKAVWDEIHQDYEKSAFSLTPSLKICEMLVCPSHQSPSFNIPNSPEVKVLIPGCGSEIYLQKTLLEACPQIGQIYCTDFSQVGIEKALEKWKQAEGESRLNDQQIVFEMVDSTEFTEKKPELAEKFDYVLIVNSVVSGDDEINRKMIYEFSKVLKPGGKIYGFFQSTLCYVEICYLSRQHAHCMTEGFVDVAHNKVWDAEWQNAQIYYTPLRLNRIFKEAGMKRLSMEIDFLDSEPFAEMFQQMIGHDDPDIYCWQLLVRYEKEKV